VICASPPPIQPVSVLLSLGFFLVFCTRLPSAVTPAPLGGLWCLGVCFGFSFISHCDRQPPSPRDATRTSHRHVAPTLRSCSPAFSPAVSHIIGSLPPLAFYSLFHLADYPPASDSFLPLFCTDILFLMKLYILPPFFSCVSPFSSIFL